MSTTEQQTPDGIDRQIPNSSVQQAPKCTDGAHKCVYHAGERRDFTVKGSFGYAFEGIGYAFKTQRNFKIHLAIGILAVILGILLQIDAASWAAVVICIAAMFSAELINTSIEAVVDMVSPGWHELAKRAKDCAAAAVCVVAFGSVVVGAIVFIPKLIALMSF